jgi:hypothetical protein
MLARSSTRTSALLLAALLAACGKSDKAPTTAEGAAGAVAADPPSPVHIAVSVDWEGAHFDPDGLAALARFREANPGVPLTHLLNAAYFTKPGADATHAIREMKQALREGDEAGLHVHLWKSLVEAAGVEPRLERSFLTGTDTLLEFEDDTGFEVDPDVYSVHELRATYRRSRELLEQNGFTLAPVFRAGGWIGTAKVLEAVRAEGFTIDSSSTDGRWLVAEESGVLGKRVQEVWPSVDRTTQPFFIDTPAGQLLEMPDSGALADYLTAEQMEEHVRWAAGETKKNTARPVFVHLGFHAETAHHFAPRLTEALASLRKGGVAMRFETLSTSAAAARAALEGATAAE